MSVFEEVPPLVDTPLHVHEHEDELFLPLEGEHVFQVGDEEHRAGPGERGLRAARGPALAAPRGARRRSDADRHHAGWLRWLLPRARRGRARRDARAGRLRRGLRAVRHHLALSVACHGTNPRPPRNIGGRPISSRHRSCLNYQMNTRTRPHSHAADRRRGHTHSRGHRAPVLDAVIVGGGPAGLSAALVLGRARQRVLVLDTGRPANAASNGIGGPAGAERAWPPRTCGSAGREQLAGFPNVEVRDGAVLDADSAGRRLRREVRRRRGAQRARWCSRTGCATTRRRCRASSRLWGRSVFHCPFCDGWEVRDLSLAVHGSGPEAARSALVVAGWSRDVVLCTDGPGEPERRARRAGERRRPRARGAGPRAGRRRRLAPADRVRIRPRRAARRHVRAHPPRPAERPRRRARLRADAPAARS